MTCAAFGIALAHDADLSFALGPPLHWVLEQLGFTEENMADAIAVFETAHTERIDLITPMPGADIVLRDLAASGIEIGVATIKPGPLAHIVLKTLGLRDCVHTLHGRADDMDPRTKTDLLREARDELGGDAPLYVGDHRNDEAAARELGIPFLWYPQNSWGDIAKRILTADGP